MKTLFSFLILMLCQTAYAQHPDPSADITALGKEVATKGWIAYCARTEKGDWDLFECRPDGSDVRNITNTPSMEEAGPRFSADGKRLLFRRMPLGTRIDHDIWGTQGQLVLAESDGSNALAYGEDGEFPWASWTPDGKGLVCLAKDGIHFVDLASKEYVRSMPRKGIFQQLFLSPDGKWLTGTGNHQGVSWTIVRMNVETGEMNPVRIDQNCTPDWAPDSKRIIFSSRPKGQTTNKGYGFTQLCIADGDGSNAQLLYFEEGFHIYGGELSPDGKYVLFTKSPMDGGASEKGGAPIYLMRLSDAPIIRGKSLEVRQLHPKTNDGPIISLSTGWEPIWTYAEIGSSN